MSKIEYRVCAKITQRAALGKKKYGTTMERDDLTPLDWLKHAQEEAMDLAVYLEKLIQELEELKRVTPKSGRVVMFNGRRWHTAAQPVNNVRCIINYNVI